MAHVSYCWSRILSGVVFCSLGTLAAAAPGTITIGGETKQVEGVLREAQVGDVSCYLTLESADGETFYESAGFEICEDESLIGKRLHLTYSLENVLAAECQGDVDCGKSDQVALVTAVKILPQAAGTSPQSHCQSSETIVFSCRTGTKQVSVCASADATASAGQVQYRFGKRGSAAAIELVLPKRPAAPAQSAHGAVVPFSGGGGSWLRFRNGDHAYVVYSGIGRWGPNGETIEKEGVVVERRGETIAHLPCTGPLTSELGPDWLDQVGITDGDEAFDFPE